jgi:hypothetical protein
VKIVFLDFDGVLVPLAKKYQKTRPAVPSFVAVLNLNWITDTTGARIVVSSSWARGSSLEKLEAMLKAWGVTGKVVGKVTYPNVHVSMDADAGVTILKTYCPRGAVIKSWLECIAPKFLLDNDPIESFVILDDEEDVAPFKSRLVKIAAPTLGLRKVEADLAIQLLGDSFSGGTTLARRDPLSATPVICGACGRLFPVEHWSKRCDCEDEKL